MGDQGATADRTVEAVCRHNQTFVTDRMMVGGAGGYGQTPGQVVAAGAGERSLHSRV